MAATGSPAVGPRVSGDVGLFERERGQRLLSIILSWADECLQQLLRRVSRGHGDILEGRARNERLITGIEEQYRQGLDVMVNWCIGDIQRESQLILARDEDTKETLTDCIKYFALEYSVVPRLVDISELLATFVPIFSKRVDVRRIKFAHDSFIDRRAVVIDCLRCTLAKLVMTFDPRVDDKANLENPRHDTPEAPSLAPPSYVPNADDVRVAAVSLFEEECRGTSE